MLRFVQLFLLAFAANSFSLHVAPAICKDASSRFQRGVTSKRSTSSSTAAEIVKFVSTAAALVIFTTTASPCIGLAEEYESPSIFTGETVMICTKRGFNGACVKTEVRTEENDNDKSNKYMSRNLESAEVIRAKEQALRAVAANEEGSDLLEKLLQQTLENKEKNERLVRQKTIANDEGASFGPFSRSVVILNTDGETYTLLESPQAMRLKDQGYIKDRKFVEQPSQEVIDAALTPSDSEGINGLFKWVRGLGNNEE
mmetsp:Transcript_16119/g.23017  ORF Transcript_16119/g.23017 Transcript_16119/m.23017 type:complete len:257 (+) Transcript_16119:71-841(+)